MVIERPIPPPTPTTVAGTLLPIETIQHGFICEELVTEYQLFFVRSEAAWNDVWSKLRTNQTLRADESAITEVIQETDFQTQGLLLAWRTCHSYSGGGYAIVIDRAVQVSADQLYVYIGLQYPAAGSVLPAAWFYEIARITWPEENSDNPTVEVVDYILWSDRGKPKN
jgi:hypothetical protein